MAEKRIKILHVLTDKNIGGAGRWLLYYLNYHNREKFEVKVALPADSLLCEAVRQKGVEVIALAELADCSFDKRAFRPLWRLMRQEKPDILHTHASLTARLAGRAAGVPTIIHTKHCMEGSPGKLPKKLARRAMNHCLSDCIIAVSKAVRRSMIVGGTSPKKIVTIYNGIERIAIPSAAEKAALLVQYGGREGELAVGIVARLEEVKDHETFLRAAAEILKKRQDVRFYIIGDGSLREKLRARAEALGISEKVTFTGFIKEIEALEAALDIAVITSKQEALCLSLLESMIAGIPAVGTDSGGVAEVIKDGENGYLVPVGDAHRLALRIEMLLADAEKRQKMGEAAAQYAAAHFLAEQMTRKIEKLYLEEKR